MTLQITAFYAGLLTLWLVFLSAAVIMRRRRLAVSLGHGGNDTLLHAVRAHGNAVETVPLALVGMALSETLGTPGWLLHLLGIGLMVGRVAHGAHFLSEREDLTLRTLGMGLTLFVLSLLGVGLIGHGLADMG
ncbi:MAG: MAPEG family protein [Pseudomonadota bacterium]